MDYFEYLNGKGYLPNSPRQIIILFKNGILLGDMYPFAVTKPLIFVAVQV